VNIGCAVPKIYLLIDRQRDTDTQTDMLIAIFLSPMEAE